MRERENYRTRKNEGCVAIRTRFELPHRTTGSHRRRVGPTGPHVGMLLVRCKVLLRHRRRVHLRMRWAFPAEATRGVHPAGGPTPTQVRRRGTETVISPERAEGVVLAWSQMSPGAVVLRESPRTMRLSVLVSVSVSELELALTPGHEISRSSPVRRRWRDGSGGRIRQGDDRLARVVAL